MIKKVKILAFDLQLDSSMTCPHFLDLIHII